MLFIPITLNCELATFGPVERVLGGSSQGLYVVSIPHPDAGTLWAKFAVSIPDGDVVGATARGQQLIPQLSLQRVDWFYWRLDRYFYALDSEPVKAMADAS